jgi:hypothetical protein
MVAAAMHPARLRIGARLAVAPAAGFITRLSRGRERDPLSPAFTRFFRR